MTFDALPLWAALAGAWALLAASFALGFIVGRGFRLVAEEADGDERAPALRRTAGGPSS